MSDELRMATFIALTMPEARERLEKALQSDLPREAVGHVRDAIERIKKAEAVAGIIRRKAVAEADE